MTVFVAIELVVLASGRQRVGRCLHVKIGHLMALLKEAQVESSHVRSED
jgi:hypothetical protein